MKLSIILGALLISGQVLAANQSAQSQSNQQNDTSSGKVISTEQLSITQKPVTPDQRKMLNAAAVRVLNKIADTRFAIHMKNYNIARSDIDQAASALSTVSNLSPTATVRDKVDLARKHLDYQTSAKVSQELIPIAANLDEIAEYVPTGTAKQHLDQARKDLDSGNKKSAQNHLKLLGDALVYKEIDLPVTQTQALVSQARNALYSNHPQKADDALRTAENAMPTFESAVVANPAPSQNQRAPSSTSGQPQK